MKIHNCLLCLCFFLPSVAWSMGKKSKTVVPYLQIPEIVSPSSDAISKMLFEVEKRTSLNVDYQAQKINVTSKELFSYPLVILLGSQAFPKLPNTTLSILRSFLNGGGTLFINFSNGNMGEGFDLSIRRMVQRIYPGKSLQKLPAEHTLLKSFYLLRRLGGRVLNQSFIEGVTRDDRTSIVYSANDHNGAWERDSFGNWTYPVVPGGYSQREHAFRFGINLLMYVLCVNYKSDMVHIPFIMKRRK